MIKKNLTFHIRLKGNLGDVILTLILHLQPLLLLFLPSILKILNPSCNMILVFERIFCDISSQINTLNWYYIIMLVVGQISNQYLHNSSYLCSTDPAVD